MAHIQKANSKLYRPESTHDKVDSQKMFIDNIEQMEKNFMALDRTMKMYKGLTEINKDFTTATPIETVISTMDNASGLIADIATENSSNTIYPTQYGTLYIYKIRTNRVQLEFVSNENVVHRNHNKRWFAQSNDGVFGGWRQYGEAGGYTIINETYLTTPIVNCATLDELISQIPEKCILYGHTWYAPSWFPNGAVASNWMIKVVKSSNSVIKIELDDVSTANVHYIAGYSYGTTFTGWDHIGVTDAVIPATVI